MLTAMIAASCSSKSKLVTGHGAKYHAAQMMIAAIRNRSASRVARLIGIN